MEGFSGFPKSRYPLIIIVIDIAGFDIKFLLASENHYEFSIFFRFLELRNEFYSIDLPHVGYFLCII